MSLPDALMKAGAEQIGQALTPPLEIVRDAYGNQTLSKNPFPQREYQGNDQFFRWASQHASAAALSVEILDQQDKGQALASYIKLGGKTPAAVQDASERFAAVEAVVMDPPVFNVLSIPTEEVGDRFREHVDAMVRADKAREIRHTISVQAQAAFIAAVTAATSDVLADKTIRSQFDTAAASFTKLYPSVKSFRTLTDAAGADETGAGVVAWHSAVSAVRELNAVVDLIIGFACRKRTGLADGTPRSRVGGRGVLGISADVPEDAQQYLSVVQGVIDFDNAKVDPEVTWNVYGAQLDGGATLSLPSDLKDLRRRKADFDPKAIRDAAALKWFE
jgi:hypothetical protein